MDCTRSVVQRIAHSRGRISSLASVLTMRRGTSVTQSQERILELAAETDRTEVYHPFTMIPANARAIFVWAVACILKLLRSIQRDDRKAVRRECEKVISAIDAEVRSPCSIWIRRLLRNNDNRASTPTRIARIQEMAQIMNKEKTRRVRQSRYLRQMYLWSEYRFAKECDWIDTDDSVFVMCAPCVRDVCAMWRHVCAMSPRRQSFNGSH